MVLYKKITLHSIFTQVLSYLLLWTSNDSFHHTKITNFNQFINLILNSLRNFFIKQQSALIIAWNMCSENIHSVRKTFPPLWGLVSTSLMLLSVIFNLIASTNSAHIVFFHNIASYSHRVTTYPLADALAKRGHQITFINPFVNRDPYVNPNITEIVPATVEKSMREFLAGDFDINHRITKTFQRIVFAIYPAAIRTCQEFLDSPELEEFYKRTKSVELVIIDNFMAECAVTLAYKYGAKHIIFNTVTHLPNEFDQWGFQPETSSIPEYEIDPPIPPMTFYERVFNALVSIHFRWEHYKFMGALDLMARSHLKDPSMPFLDDLVRNTSLVLYPGDVVTDYPRSQSPLFVNIGGIYCKNASGSLPEGLVEFLEEDTNFEGLAYISLGSLALSSNLPERVKQVFMDTIRQFPKLRFIWKWDSPTPANKPANLYLAKWLPQTEILAHPKMKLFVTQCGRPSMSEALCNGVPMIAFPVLGDQDNNANKMEKMGANMKLELGTVTIQQFKEAVEKTVYDKRFKERLSELRNMLLDRPLPALETAVWWTEYVLRHKDTSHLRPSGFDQWWYQRRLLDVWAFLFTIIFTFLVILPMLMCVVCRKCILSQKNKMPKKDQKIKPE